MFEQLEVVAHKSYILNDLDADHCQIGLDLLRVLVADAPSHQRFMELQLFWSVVGAAALYVGLHVVSDLLHELLKPQQIPKGFIDI